MTTLTIRKIPDAVHRALKVRAAHAGRSTEAELRLIIEEAVMPKTNLANAMLAIGQSFGGLTIAFARDKRAYKPPVFE
jgi:antitoxin FitA